MATYRNRIRPAEIEAVKVVYAEMLATGPEHTPFEECPEWVRAAVEAGTLTLSARGARDYAVVEVHTPDGIMEATPGDFLMRVDTGEIFACQPGIFARTYERKGTK